MAGGGSRWKRFQPAVDPFLDSFTTGTLQDDVLREGSVLSRQELDKRVQFEDEFFRMFNRVHKEGVWQVSPFAGE
jgi:hypothetical protein